MHLKELREHGWQMQSASAFLRLWGHQLVTPQTVIHLQSTIHEVDILPTQPQEFTYSKASQSGAQEQCAVLILYS
jgi:hypothetical protein